MKRFLKAFYDNLMMDVQNENETKKAAVQMRFLCLIFSAFFLLQAFLGLFSFPNRGVALLNVIGMLCYLLAFRQTYYGRTNIIQKFITIFTIFWTILFVVLIGWDCGIQHFLVVVLVFFCMTSYARIWQKALFAAFITGVRLFLFFFCRFHTPVVPLSRTETDIFQVVNSLACYLALTVLVLLFSKDSLEMETKLINYNKRIEMLANADPLTGLPNRRYMTTQIEKTIKNASSNSGFINLAIGDIDFFKKVNDTYGHAAGDALLKQLAQIFMTKTAGHGEVARWGGEEFLFLLVSMNGDEASTFLNDLRHVIKSKEFECEGHKIKITMTFGLEEWGSGQTYDETIEAADNKLYYGKEHGRDQVVF